MEETNQKKNSLLFVSMRVLALRVPVGWNLEMDFSQWYFCLACGFL